MPVGHLNKLVLAAAAVDRQAAPASVAAGAANRQGRGTAHSKHCCASPETEKAPAEPRDSLQSTLRVGGETQRARRPEGRLYTNGTLSQTRSTARQARSAREGLRHRRRRRCLLLIRTSLCSLPCSMLLEDYSYSARLAVLGAGAVLTAAWLHAARGLPPGFPVRSGGGEESSCLATRVAATLFLFSFALDHACIPARSAWPQRCRCWPSTAPCRCCSAGWMQSIPGSPTK